MLASQSKVQGCNNRLVANVSSGVSVKMSDMWYRKLIYTHVFISNYGAQKESEKCIV